MYTQSCEPLVEVSYRQERPTDAKQTFVVYTKKLSKTVNGLNECLPSFKNNQ